MTHKSAQRDAGTMGYRMEYFARMRAGIAPLIMLSPASLLGAWILNTATTPRRPLFGDDRLVVLASGVVSVGLIYSLMLRARTLQVHGWLTIMLLSVTTCSLALLAIPDAHGCFLMLPVILVVPLVAAPFWVSPLRSFAACLLPYTSGSLLLFRTGAYDQYASTYLSLTIVVTVLCLAIFTAMDRSRRLAYHDRSELYKVAHYDTLTGLASRRRFQELGTKAMLKARLDQTPISLAFADLDRFKSVNDLHGHAAGDRALARVAELIISRMRHGMVAGRFGGEEFILLLPDMTAKHATVFTEQLARDVSRTDLGGFSVTLSAGVAEARDHDSLSTLMQRADEALLHAKSSGRNKVLEAT